MIITGLRYQIKNPDRVSVYLDGAYVFSLTVTQLLEEKLSVGLTIDAERRTELEERSYDGKLVMRAMNWTLLRPRSVRETRDYLFRVLRQRHSRDDIERKTAMVIDELRRHSWLDDRRFAEWWLARRTSERKSQRVLRAELAKKGIDRELIDELTQRSDARALRQLIATLQTKPKYADHQKLMRYLAAKGFNYSSISEALDGSDAGDSDE